MPQSTASSSITNRWYPGPKTKRRLVLIKQKQQCYPSVLLLLVLINILARSSINWFDPVVAATGTNRHLYDTANNTSLNAYNTDQCMEVLTNNDWDANGMMDQLAEYPHVLTQLIMDSSECSSSNSSTSKNKLYSYIENSILNKNFQNEEQNLFSIAYDEMACMICEQKQQTDDTNDTNDIDAGMTEYCYYNCNDSFNFNLLNKTVWIPTDTWNRYSYRDQLCSMLQQISRAVVSAIDSTNDYKCDESSSISATSPSSSSIPSPNDASTSSPDENKTSYNYTTKSNNYHNATSFISELSSNVTSSASYNITWKKKNQYGNETTTTSNTITSNKTELYNITSNASTVASDNPPPRHKNRYDYFTDPTDSTSTVDKNDPGNGGNTTYYLAAQIIIASTFLLLALCIFGRCCNRCGETVIKSQNGPTRNKSFKNKKSKKHTFCLCPLRGSRSGASTSGSSTTSSSSDVEKDEEDGEVATDDPDFEDIVLIEVAEFGSNDSVSLQSASGAHGSVEMELSSPPLSMPLYRMSDLLEKLGLFSKDENNCDNEGEKSTTIKIRQELSNNLDQCNYSCNHGGINSCVDDKDDDEAPQSLSKQDSCAIDDGATCSIASTKLLGTHRRNHYPRPWNIDSNNRNSYTSSDEDDVVWNHFLSDTQREEAWQELMEESHSFQHSDDYYTSDDNFVVDCRENNIANRMSDSRVISIARSNNDCPRSHQFDIGHAQAIISSSSEFAEKDNLRDKSDESSSHMLSPGSYYYHRYLNDESKGPIIDPRDSQLRHRPASLLDLSCITDKQRRQQSSKQSDRQQQEHACDDPIVVHGLGGILIM